MRKLVVFLFTFAWLCLSLGLAVWGFGGFEAFFSHRALVAVTAITVLLGLAAVFTRGNLSSGTREDRSNRWVLTVFAVLGLLQAWLPAFTDRIGFLTIDGEASRWLGVGIYTVGGALRLWPVFVLGRRFSGLVAIQSGHQLVTTGPYARIRNPSYLGMLLTLVGWAFAFRSGVGLVVAALTLIPVIGRIRSEEKMLRSEFGAEWEAYAARTWRLVPLLY